MKVQTEFLWNDQIQSDGYNWNFGNDGGILTVFSTRDYCETGNNGAYAMISNKGNVCCSKLIVDAKLEDCSKHILLDSVNQNYIN